MSYWIGLPKFGLEYRELLGPKTYFQVDNSERTQIRSTYADQLVSLTNKRFVVCKPEPVLVTFRSYPPKLYIQSIGINAVIGYH